MEQQIFNVIRSQSKWLRIFSPHSKIRFYPPQFLVRNPMAKSVKKAIDHGFEVAVIVFHMNNYKKLRENADFSNFLTCLKVVFKDVVMKQVKEDDLLILHDYIGEGIALLLRFDPSKFHLAEVDELIGNLLADAETKLADIMPNCRVTFDTGYMFVEKKNVYIEDALEKAHRHAIVMAEKKTCSEYNELTLTMQQIISSRNIRLLAQPIFSVETREIKAYEVLTRGPINTELEYPLVLFSVARQTGLLYQLELIVLEKTLQQITENESTQTIFINFTPLTIGDEKFINDMKHLLIQYPSILTKRMVIEITERDSIDSLEHFATHIKQLKNMGFRIAVDDTGAGYSSLNTISEIMPDIIKVDRSVIKNIDSNTVKESILQGLLLIAREAGSVVVAEGIENAEEAMVLSRNKVELAQGYFYAKPEIIEKLPILS